MDIKARRSRWDIGAEFGAMCLERGRSHVPRNAFRRDLEAGKQRETNSPHKTSGGKATLPTLIRLLISRTIKRMHLCSFKAVSLL